MQQQSSDFEKQYRLKANFVYVIALYIFFRRLISSSMLSQMDHPVMVFQQSEFIYRWFFASGIGQFLTSNTVIASLFDISLLIASGGFMLTYKRIYAIVFTLLVVVYFLTYNIVTTHNYHGMVALIVASIPFWFSSEKRFNFTWEAARYYFLFIFASAALWKIGRGSAFQPEQLANILKSQQLDLILQNPGTLRVNLAEYLIGHPNVSFFIEWVNVVFQLSFLAGFFTKKYDHILFVMAIVFCIANFFVMGIVSIELLILDVTLLNWDWVEKFLIEKGMITNS